ncbi:MAG: AraC family transcriptional regulator [Fimbriiglobus sp.]|nr:AraC family transcriptional regulator [Fimbriiglobus sp.]
MCFIRHRLRKIGQARLVVGGYSSTMTPYTRHRIFRGFIGESVGESVRRRRRGTERSVLEIAPEAGYGTHESFTRAFKERFGVTPTECRTVGLNTPFAQKRETMPTTFDATQLSVRVKHFDPMRIAFRRHVGPYEGVQPVFMEFMKWVAAKGLFADHVLEIGVCHDDPAVTDADKIRYDCAVTVDEKFQPEGDVQVGTLAGGDYAVVEYRGPYTDLDAVYHHLYAEWLPASGREARNAPPFEIYRRGPGETTPDDYLTEVCLPLDGR